MARVTVEDCLKNVDNRFDLVIKAAKRAHLLELGAADPTVPLDNDKPTVVALREIAAGHDITKTRVSSNEEVKAEADAAEMNVAASGKAVESTPVASEKALLVQPEAIVKEEDTSSES